MGDHLFARAFELIAECDNLNIISSSCRATSAMCRGEIEQLQWIGRADVPEEAYFRLIEMKTAALMASCAESAALLCGKGDDTAEWYGFGLRLGLVFQMTDDLLDFTADETSLGKRVSSDAADGKYTLPLILYRERIGGADALEDFLRESEDPNDIFEALEREGAFEATRKRIEELAGTCHADLDRLDGKAAGELAFARIHELVDFVVERDR
jgi:octaprenyl-diphosphate synthase